MGSNLYILDIIEKPIGVGFDKTMATMIPNDVKEFCTEGERVFFNCLRSVAKPDSRYIAWYLPDINEKEPDFLLYCEDVGLVIFEVKDWTLDQIQEANPHSSLLDISDLTRLTFNSKL